MHQVHAPGAVGGVVADQDGAGIHGAALGDAHQKEGQRQQKRKPGKAHEPVAQQVAEGQQKDAGLEPQNPGQDAGQKARQQVADAHQGEQGAGHAVGKPVLLLQQTHHHAAGDGADAAEKRR